MKREGDRKERRVERRGTVKNGDRKEGDRQEDDRKGVKRRGRKKVEKGGKKGEYWQPNLGSLGEETPYRK